MSPECPRDDGRARATSTLLRGRCCRDGRAAAASTASNRCVPRRSCRSPPNRCPGIRCGARCRGRRENPAKRALENSAGPGRDCRPAARPAAVRAISGRAAREQPIGILAAGKRHQPALAGPTIANSSIACRVCRNRRLRSLPNSTAAARRQRADDRLARIASNRRRNFEYSWLDRPIGNLRGLV